jgi:hypothetical protein
MVAPTTKHPLPPTASVASTDVCRRDLLGGLLHEYDHAAA